MKNNSIHHGKLSKAFYQMQYLQMYFQQWQSSLKKNALGGIRTSVKSKAACSVHHSQ